VDEIRGKEGIMDRGHASRFGRTRKESDPG